MNTCNICNYTGHFLDHADRVSVRCPKCRSFERQRFIWEYISARIDDFSNKKILHIAPEINLQHRLKSITFNYIGIDISPIRFGNDIIEMDINNLLFDDNSIDIVICSHVLEHIKDDTRAIQEIYRVIKPNGFSVICVPMYDHSYTIEHKIPDGLNHYRNYGFDDLNNKLSIYFYTKIISATDMDLDLQKKYSLQKYQKIFVCNKKI